ncbi:MAG TPA: PAS domain-containing protein [Steroidobacteraceae bacterium]|nr:PAS domain-containing protein [Steroidobacteraceae bacterium]
MSARDHDVAYDTRAPLAQVLGGTRIVSWTWRAAGDRFEISSNARTVLGWPAHEPLEKSGWQLSGLHPLDAEERHLRLQHAFELQQPFFGEFRIIRADTRETEWMEERGTVFVDPDTGELGLAGVLWSIATRRREIAFLASSRTLDRQRSAGRDPSTKLAELLRSERRMQSAFQIETIGIAFFDNSGQITEANDAYLRMFGFPSIDFYTGTLRWGDGTAPEWTDLLTRARDEYWRTGQVAPHERECIRRDGAHWWGLFAARRLNEVEGIEYVVDISNRIDAERELRENQRRMRVLIEGIPQIVWRAIGAGCWTWASPQWTQLTGQPELHSHGSGWLDMVHPDDRPRVKSQWEHARVTESFALDYRVWHVKENRYRAFKTRARPVHDDAGRIVEWLGTSTDVDELEQSHAREQVLNAELQHRTRNLLALVRSLTRQTLGPERCAPNDLDVLDSRLAALGRVQKLLDGSIPGISLRGLLEAELAALGEVDGPAAELRGPDVLLPSAHVQTLALALHELATNAAKYGAFAYKGAHLTVQWTLYRSAQQPGLLDLEWIERGVPMPAEPPARKGFGRELLEEALTFTLGSRTQFAFAADGVRFHIQLPL